ncbi:hypothetical protein INT44_005805 [Umbelopsis vinacea]|uniref:Uncharacterized protein n=1 Tax=Umbelopsis vinacea TaxID=44442 RepID=A0A8H7UH34_9FUNG|nr:hypothetical protein INT44_005805 [Umbelopsis vinacea]
MGYMLPANDIQDEGSPIKYYVVIVQTSQQSCQQGTEDTETKEQKTPTDMARRYRNQGAEDPTDMAR